MLPYEHLVLLGHFRLEFERPRRLLNLGSAVSPAVLRHLRLSRRQAPGLAGSLVDSCPPAPVDTLRDTRRGVICSCSRTDQVVSGAGARRAFDTHGGGCAKRETGKACGSSG